MSDAEFASSTIQRAWEPPEEVVVPLALAFAPELQPEDYGVLIRLLLRDPEKPSSVKELSEEFKATGWKMGDSRLRGVMRRLREAGHVHRGRDGYDEETGRPKWAFAVYRNPENNPQHRGRRSASSQVSGKRGFSTDRGSSPVSDALDSNVYAGQADPLESNVHGAAPPTPPHREEEDSSSPNPSAATAAPAVAQTLRIQAAGEFLAELPGQWACGRKTVRLLAPLLAEAAHAQGWPLDPALAAHLTRRSRRGGQKEPAGLLRERIEDLPRYTAARAAAAAEQQLKFPEPTAPGDSSPAREPEQPPAPVDPEVVHQARALLLTLTGPWTLSPESADRLAPLLAAKALERGWAFDDALRTKLMENPGGAHNHELLLETRRIGRLPYRKQPPSQPGPAAGVPWCGSCESETYRWITPREGKPRKCPACNPSIVLATA